LINITLLKYIRLPFLLYTLYIVSRFNANFTIHFDSVNLPSEIKCENPPMTAECSAFRCMYSTIYLTPFQCRALPGPVPRRESRETALAVSIQKGLSVSLRQELPGHSVSSVLSLDSAPAPVSVRGDTALRELLLVLDDALDLLQGHYLFSKVISEYLLEVAYDLVAVVEEVVVLIKIRAAIIA